MNVSQDTRLFCGLCLTVQTNVLCVFCVRQHFVRAGPEILTLHGLRRAGGIPLSIHRRYCFFYKLKPSTGSIPMLGLCCCVILTARHVTFFRSSLPAGLVPRQQNPLPVSFRNIRNHSHFRCFFYNSTCFSSYDWNNNLNVVSV